MNALPRPGRLLAAALALAAVAGAAACGSGVGNAPYQTERTTPTPAPSSAGNPPGCASGRVEISWRMGEALPAELCVRVGSELVITLRGAPGYEWTPVQSVQPAVIAVVTHATHGVATATGHALTPGASELRSTVSFTGDPFGPPTLLWRQAIRVVA